MKVLGMLLAAVTLAGSGASARAEEKADARKLLVGRWEAVKVDPNSLPLASVVELTRDGKVKVNGKTETKEINHEGTYVVEGNSFTVTMKAEGKEGSFKIKINKISESEMDTVNEEGKKVLFRRIK